MQSKKETKKTKVESPQRRRARKEATRRDTENRQEAALDLTNDFQRSFGVKSLFDMAKARKEE